MYTTNDGEYFYHQNQQADPLEYHHNYNLVLLMNQDSCNIYSLDQQK